MEQPEQSHSQRRFTRQEVLQWASAFGVPLLDRQLTNWIGRGILPEPHHPGQGQGLGSTSWWSEEQLRFMSIIFSTHRQIEIPLELMYHVPVYYWLYDGPACGVSLTQVQRATKRWAQARHGRFVAHKGREVAGEFVRQLAPPGAKGTRALQRTLAEWGAGQSVDTAELVFRLDTVITPRLHSPAGVEPATLIAEHLEGLMTTWQYALKEGTKLPDLLWEWARMRVLLSQAASKSDTPIVEQAVARGHLEFQQPYGDGFDTPCAELLFGLGVAYQITRQGEDLHGFPAALHPAFWEAGTPKARIASRRVESRLVLPQGHISTYHSITISFVTATSLPT